MATTAAKVQTLTSKQLVKKTKTIDVSGHGNNCGLFALSLGIKLALEKNPPLKSSLNKEFIEILDKYSKEALQGRDSKTVVEVSNTLRNALAAALKEDIKFKNKQFMNFHRCATNVLEAVPNPAEVNSLVLPNSKILDELKQNWSGVIKLVNSNIDAWNKEYKAIVEKSQAYLSQDRIQNLRQELSDFISSASDIKKLTELIDTYLSDIENIYNNEPMFSYVNLCLLFNIAHREGKEGQSGIKLGQKISNALYRHIEWLILKKLHSKDLESKTTFFLFLMACCEETHFQNTKTFVISEHGKIISSMKALFAKFLLIRNKELMYQNYCEYLRKSKEKISADELGILAKHWHVQLTVKFNNNRVYNTHAAHQKELLQIILSNKSEEHWQVEYIEPSPAPTGAQPHANNVEIKKKQELEQSAVAAMDETEDPEDKTAPLQSEPMSLQTSAIQPIKVQDILDKDKSAESSHYAMSHLYAISFKAMEYQLLAFMNRVTRLLLKKQRFKAQIEVNEKGNLDDFSVTLLGKDLDTPISVECYQVKHFVDPISVHDFFKDTESEDELESDASKKSNADKNEKGVKHHIGKFFDGWLNWREDTNLVHLISSQFQSILYTNTGIDGILNSCIEPESRKFKAHFVSQEKEVSVLKNPTMSVKIPKNFLTKLQIKKIPSPKLSTKIWEVLHKEGYLKNGEFTEKFSKTDRATFQKGFPTNCLGRNSTLTVGNIYSHLKSYYQKFQNNKGSLFEMLYTESIKYLTRHKSHLDLLEKTEEELKKEFQEFLKSFVFNIKQPDIEVLEKEIQETLFQITQEKSDYTFLCLYYTIREWFRKEYPNFENDKRVKKVPIFTNEILQKLINESLIRSRDLVFLQQLSNNNLTHFEGQSLERFVERPELKQLKDAIENKKRLVVLAGEKGLGKSSLAKQYLDANATKKFLFLPATAFSTNAQLQKILKKIIEKEDYINTVVIDAAENLINVHNSLAQIVASLVNKNCTLILTTTPGVLSEPALKKVMNQFRAEVIEVKPLAESAILAAYPEFNDPHFKKSLKTAVLPFNLSLILRLKKRLYTGFDVSMQGIKETVELAKLLMEGPDPKLAEARRIAWQQLSFKIFKAHEGLHTKVLIPGKSKVFELLIQERLVLEGTDGYSFAHDLFFESGLMNFWLFDWEVCAVKETTGLFWQELINSIKASSAKTIFRNWLISNIEKLSLDLIQCAGIVSNLPNFKMLLMVALQTKQNALLLGLLKGYNGKLNKILNQEINYGGDTFCTMAIESDNAEGLKILLDFGATSYHPEFPSIYKNRKNLKQQFAPMSDSEDENPEQEDEGYSLGEYYDNYAGDSDDDSNHSDEERQRIEELNQEEDRRRETAFDEFVRNPRKYWQLELEDDAYEDDEINDFEFYDESSYVVDKDYISPNRFYLHLAAKVNSIGCLKVLLEYRKIHYFDQDHFTQHNESLLHIAALYGKVPLFNLLYDFGFSVDSDNFQETPLHNTAYTGNVAVAEILLEEGSLPNSENEFGLTACHIAVMRMDIVMIKLLMSYGGDFTSAISKFPSNTDSITLLEHLDENSDDLSAAKQRFNQFIISFIQLLNFGWNTNQFHWGEQCDSVDLNLKKMQLSLVHNLKIFVADIAKLSNVAPGFDYWNDKTELRYAIKVNDKFKLTALAYYIIADHKRIHLVLEKKSLPEKIEIIDAWFLVGCDEPYYFSELHQYAMQYKDKELLTHLNALKAADDKLEADNSLSESEVESVSPSQETDEAENESNSGVIDMDTTDSLDPEPSLHFQYASKPTNSTANNVTTGSKSKVSGKVPGARHL